VSIDPTDGRAVRDAWSEWLADRSPTTSVVGNLTARDGGMSTFIWFADLVEPPVGWPAAVAVRIFGRPDEAATATRESAVMEHVAVHRIPVPVPLAVAAAPEANPLGLPFVVLPRVPGRTLLAEIVATPWRFRRALDDLAAMAVAIHAVPVGGLGLPGAPPLVDRWRARLRDDAGADPIVGPLLDRLDRHADHVRDEHPVLCHGDYHPLNVLSARTATGWDHQVIDWTDAVIGDREFDVARTAGLMSLASIAAEAAIERVALRAAGPIMRSTYLRSYRRRASLDPLRLRFWEAAHIIKGVAQVRNLDRVGSRTVAAAGLDDRLESKLVERSERALQTLDETA
jgi:aminoglycoside phosphotransferase (APT) family kinase protein